MSVVKGLNGASGEVKDRSITEIKEIGKVINECTKYEAELEKAKKVEKELELKEKELNLKEQEIKLREKEIDNRDSIDNGRLVTEDDRNRNDQRLKEKELKIREQEVINRQKDNEANEKAEKRKALIELGKVVATIAGTVVWTVVSFKILKVEDSGGFINSKAFPGGNSKLLKM